MIDEETRRAIVAEIVAATRVRRKQPWQFDVNDYRAQQPELSREHAYHKLMQLVHAGTLRSELVTDQGKQVRAFWRPGDEPATE